MVEEEPGYETDYHVVGVLSHGVWAQDVYV